MAYNVLNTKQEQLLQALKTYSVSVKDFFTKDVVVYVNIPDSKITSLALRHNADSDVHKAMSEAEKLKAVPRVRSNLFHSKFNTLFFSKGC
mgnify:CR=1 FL=1